MFILVTTYPPKFAIGQMVQMTKTAMERCGLFQNHLNIWSVFTANTQDWGNMKPHFGEAYENLLISGSGVSVPGTITNVQEVYDGTDDSITTITNMMSMIKAGILSNSRSACGVRPTNGTHGYARARLETRLADVEEIRDDIAGRGGGIR